MPGISSDDVLSPSLLEHLSLLPLSDTDLEDFFMVTGYNDTQRKNLTFSEPTRNVVANAIMKTERRKLTGKKKQFDLTIFLGLPLDLILEIFGHLHPIDIYHIAQTSKSLRNVVLARNSASLWKACFSRHPEVPSCPPDMSTPRWATLLFGPMVCDDCGKYGARLDFSFRQHLCSACFNRLCVPKVPELDVALYEPDDIVWGLVPVSHRYVGDYYNQTYEDVEVVRYGRFLRKDLQTMTQKLKELREDITKNKPGSKAAFEAFKESTEEQVKALMKHARPCREWALDIFNSVIDEKKDLFRSFQARIRERMIGLGHDGNNVCSYGLQTFLYSFESRKTHKLTRRFWRENKTSFEALVASRKEERQMFARATLLDTRRCAFQSIYLEYLKTLSPKTWDKLPGYKELFQFEAIYSLLNDPSDTALNELVCREVFAKLPEYLHQWRQLKLQSLLAQLPDAKATGLTDPTISMHKLYLATSVFTCTPCGASDASGICLFGWDDVSVHAGCRTLARSPHDLAFYAPGSVIAGALVSFLGLDPTTASVSDIDCLDIRLLCAQCPQQYRGHKIYTWREYVNHTISMILDAQHLTQSWHLLTPDTTALVRLHESKHPSPMDYSWSCNHCPAFFRNLALRPFVMKHVKEVHSIYAPREGDDIIYHHGAGVERKPRKPVILIESPLAEFRCARCPDMGTCLYSTRRLKQHLHDKHKISTHKLGRDFVKVQLIQRSSTTLDSAAPHVQ